MIMSSSTYLLKTYIYTWNSQVQRCSCTFIKYFPKSLSQFIFLSAMYENTHFFSILLFTLGIFNYLRAENGNLVLFALKKKLLQIINILVNLKKKKTFVHILSLFSYWCSFFLLICRSPLYMMPLLYTINIFFPELLLVFEPFLILPYN